MPQITQSDLVMLCARLATSADTDVRRVYADEARWAFATFEWQMRDGGEMNGMDWQIATIRAPHVTVEALRKRGDVWRKRYGEAKAEAERQAKRALEAEFKAVDYGPLEQAIYERNVAREEVKKTRELYNETRMQYTAELKRGSDLQMAYMSALSTCKRMENERDQADRRFREASLELDAERDKTINLEKVGCDNDVGCWLARTGWSVSREQWNRRHVTLEDVIAFITKLAADRKEG